MVTSREVIAVGTPVMSASSVDLVASSASLPGAADAIRVIPLGTAAARPLFKKPFNGGVAGIAVADGDGDGVPEVIAVVRRFTARVQPGGIRTGPPENTYGPVTCDSAGSGAAGRSSQPGCPRVASPKIFCFLLYFEHRTRALREPVGSATMRCSLHRDGADMRQSLERVGAAFEVDVETRKGDDDSSCWNQRDGRLLSISLGRRVTGDDRAPLAWNHE
jgi:hypothetical protein